MQTDMAALHTPRRIDDPRLAGSAVVFDPAGGLCCESEYLAAVGWDRRGRDVEVGIASRPGVVKKIDVADVQERARDTGEARVERPNLVPWTYGIQARPSPD